MLITMSPKSSWNDTNPCYQGLLQKTRIGWSYLLTRIEHPTFLCSGSSLNMSNINDQLVVRDHLALTYIYNMVPDVQRRDQTRRIYKSHQRRCKTREQSPTSLSKFNTMMTLASNSEKNRTGLTMIIYKEDGWCNEQVLCCLDCVCKKIRTEEILSVLKSRLRARSLLSMTSCRKRKASNQCAVVKPLVRSVIDTYIGLHGSRSQFYLRAL